MHWRGVCGLDNFLGLGWNDVTPDEIGLVELTNQAGKVTNDGQTFNAKAGDFRSVHVAFLSFGPWMNLMGNVRCLRQRLPS